MRYTEPDRQLGTIMRRLGWVLSALLVTFAVVYSWVAWTVVKRDHVSELLTVAELGEKSVDIYFDKLGASLESLGFELLNAGSPVTPGLGFQLVRRFHQLHPELSNVKLAHGDGQVLVTALDENGTLAQNHGKLLFYKVFQDKLRSAADFDLGHAFQDPEHQQWVVPLRYALRDPSGRLSYVLVAQLPVHLMQAFWKDAPIANRATIGLLRDDGYLLSQFPEPVLASNEQLYGKPKSGRLMTYLQDHDFPASGFLEEGERFASDMLLRSYKRMQNYPVTLFVSLPMKQVQATWWARVQVPYILLTMLFVGGWLVYQATRRRQLTWSAEQKRSTQIQTQLAYFDSLTNLPNRRLLMDRLDQALISARRSGQVGAVMFIDLDNFKTINDARGHAVGDELLKMVAKRLGRLLREEDTVARIGGDEFVLLLPGRAHDMVAGAVSALSVAEKLRDALSEAIVIDGQTYTVSGSIGVTLLPKDGENTHDLLREADTAMYRAKKNGRNRIVFFETGMQAEVQERLALEDELKLAISQEGLQMFVQPQVDCNGRTVGAELLLRWEHATRGFVSPAVFIPVAEQTGLILSIGNWVLHQACQALVRLEQAGSKIQLSINVSPREFGQSGFVEQVAAVLDETGANASNLIFEVTEGLLIDQLEETIVRMNQLRTMGVRFSIDDFGTGFSSLGYLKRLPIDEIKIDQNFVRELPHEDGDIAIVLSMLSMARHFGVKVVAEGVENSQQAEFLIRHGCDLLQGYLYAYPMPIDAWLSAQIDAGQTRFDTPASN